MNNTYNIETYHNECIVFIAENIKREIDTHYIDPFSKIQYPTGTIKKLN